VIGALDVDGLQEAALDLGQVVGDVGHEIGVGAVGLAHDAVLVVAVVGGAQPERAAFLVRLPRRDQAPDRLLHAPARVQARPGAAGRAWPTCSGPVGFADTNSTMTGSPSPARRPNAAPATSTSATMRWRAAAVRRRLMKPGPATSIDSTQRSTADLARSAAMS